MKLRAKLKFPNKGYFLGIISRSLLLFASLTIAQVAHAQDNAASKSYARESGSDLVIGNENVELVIDQKTGYFNDVWNKKTGLHHKIPGTGLWPFSLRVGTLNTPDLLRVENSPQIKYSQRASYSLQQNPDSATVILKYSNLNGSGGMPTGIAMDVFITLGKAADYFLVRANLENKGKYSITKLSAGAGEFIASKSRDREKLAIPTCTSGTIWSNPYAFFTNRETFGYPMFGSDVILEAGWMDLYGETGGIGIGYVDRQGSTMYFNVQKGAKGMTLNWQLFNLYHEGGVESWRPAGGIYPLQPGESFQTDNWIIAPHSGDWHRMADIYREEYEKAFKGDYCDWNSTHEAARRTDIVSGINIFNVAHAKKPAVLFSELPEKMKEIMKMNGVPPENQVFVLVDHSIHAGTHMPDFIPSSPEAGGSEALKNALAKAREMGVAGVLLYGHTYYNHPEAADYVADADTGYDLANETWSDLGNVACVDCSGWLDLWRTKYVPGYDELGASGVYWDQGGTQSVVCSKTNHEHGGSAAGILSGHAEGVRKLIGFFHEGFKNRTPFFMCESGQDLLMRNTDIWDCQCGVAHYAKGGESHHEIIRYTFPYRVIAEAAANAEARNNALVNGFALQVNGGAETTENKKALEQYLRIRRELRQSMAPGYPYGFKDILGLNVSSPEVVAKVFEDSRGVTILYYATKDTSATISFERNGEPGNSGLSEKFDVTLKANEAGYKIFSAK